MATQCPSCGHALNLKGAGPGKYKPKCPKCGEFMLIVVSQDPAAPVKVSKVAPAAADPNATVAQPSAPAKPKASVDPNATVSQSIAPAKAKVNVDPHATVATQSGAPPAAKAERTQLDATLPPANKTKIGGYDATLPPEEAKKSSYDETLAADATVAVRDQATRLVDVKTSEETAPSSPGPRAAASAPAGGLKLTIPDTLGGYKIIRELGRGAMGAVFLAKQMSLDRNVAIKTIQARWAQNPVFIARFTREAYAAAQLTHHNVVQIYDLGAQSEVNYFSMEFVKGESLADLVEQKTKLDPDEAVGYIIQAARGLNFAHMHGMVHRDIKPSNLMLNDQGVVKVADMGLVKTPHLEEEDPARAGVEIGPTGKGTSLAAATADVTMANIAMGTPAYMAPEQATNAAGVDHRADIYSLGCTLYVLLTGRPPFEGASAIEVITKHKTAPVVRPEAIVKRINPELSEIVLKMVAKKPEDRYADCGEVIRALEGYLGIKSTGVFSPTDEHAETLEKCLAAYNGVGLVKLRGMLPLAYAAVCTAAFVLLLILMQFALAGAALGALVAAPVTYLLLSGIGDRTYLFEKVRAYVSSYKWSDWLSAVGGGIVALLILFLIGWLLPVIGGAILGAGCGAAFYYAIDKRLAAARKEPISRVNSLLKLLRLRGVEEAAVRTFIAKYSDNQWEEFFEELFGYEAKMHAREELSRTDQGRRRARFGTWRESIIRSIDTKLRSDQELRDRKHLQKVEENNLKAQGVDAVQARKQAQNMAEALVDEAAEARTMTSASIPGNALDPKVIAAQKRAKQLAMLAKARSEGYESKRQRERWAVLTGPLGFVLGAKLRFLLGGLLVAACVLWVQQNQLAGELDEAAAAETSTGLLDLISGGKETTPLFAFPGDIFNGFGPGIAGALLVVLGLFRGAKMSIFAIPATILALFGGVFGLPSLMSYGIAAAIAAVGLFFGRTPDDAY